MLLGEYIQHTKGSTTNAINLRSKIVLVPKQKEAMLRKPLGGGGVLTAQVGVNRLS